jgi:translation initiation factor IF-2
MRVHELAKEIGISSKELLSILLKLGFELKSAQSSVSDEAIDHVRKEAHLAKDKKDKEEAIKTAMRTTKQKTVSEPTGDSPEGEKQVAVKEKDRPVLDVENGIAVKDFAILIGHSPNELIKLLMSLGEMVTINQSMSEEAINVVADEFGYEAHVTQPEEVEEELVHTAEDKPKDLTHKPPVVTIMGHVNHGKTALLDAIRKTDVVSQEAGGITQHIGAYQIVHNDKRITFIDTPGHEAFTAMRARGAKVTDIAILVVAADDGVMPQTIEAIDHARAANVPIIIAVNKVDKPEANTDKIKKQLVDHDLIPEEWGGDTIFVEVSAKQGTNINELLEMILLVAELNEFKANEKAPVKGTIIEAKLDKTRGPTATLLVERGTLKTGAIVVAGTSSGRIKAMSDDKGNNIYKALPAQPVEILGLSTVPKAGTIAEVVQSEKMAKDIIEKRLIIQREHEQERRHVTLDNLFDQIKEGEIKDLNIILKADVQGSLEALRESLAKIDQQEVRINIVHAAVGGISETDIMLASASNAIVVGFNVRPDTKAQDMTRKEQVDMRLYNIIYRVIEDIEAARKGMLSPIITEAETGQARVLELFKVSRLGTIAGCIVEKGDMRANSKIRVVREGVVIHDGKMQSLRRFKDDVSSVSEGLECGIHLENFNDIKVDDILEGYVIEEKPRQ